MKKTAKKGAKKAVVAKSGFKVKPVGDRVVVKPESENDTRSPSGIIIPDTSKKEKPERGIVVAVGEGRRNERGELIPISISVGDTVMFSKYGFDEVTVDDDEYFIVSESSILAIITQ